MGLGVLFFGYVLVSIFTLSPVYFITDLVGSFAIFEALGKLRRHADRFRYALWSVYAMFFVSAAQCVYYAVKYVGIIEGGLIYENIIEIARLTVMFFLTVTILLSLSELASSVGDGKLADKGKRNVWFYLINYAFIIVLSLDFDFLGDFVSAFSAFGLFFRVMCAIINCVYLYSCYMWICLEGDHDMNKPSAIDRFMGKLSPPPKEKPPEQAPAPSSQPAAVTYKKKKKK